MKRLWCTIQIGDTDGSLERPSASALAAVTFLQRSYPLDITLYDETSSPPPGAVSSFTDTFYARLAENRDRIARIYIAGMVHETLWMLLHEDLVNAVEIVILCDSPAELYSNSLQGESRSEGLLEGRTLSVKKLGLGVHLCAANSYPNLTHLYLVDANYSRHGYNMLLSLLSSLSNTLQVLYFSNAGPDPSEVVLPALRNRVQLPHLQYIEIVNDKDGEGPDPGTTVLHFLSLPSSIAIFWSAYDCCANDGRIVHFPPQEHCDRVKNIFISLDADGYGCYLMEGDNVFGLSDIDSQTMHGICNGLPNITSMSLPSSCLEYRNRETTTQFTKLLEDLNRHQDEMGSLPIFCPGLLDVHVYTGESDGGLILKDETEQQISYELMERKLTPLDLSTGNSMQFYRDVLGKSFTVHFHPGDMDKRIITYTA